MERIGEVKHKISHKSQVIPILIMSIGSVSTGCVPLYPAIFRNETNRDIYVEIDESVDKGPGYGPVVRGWIVPKGQVLKVERLGSFNFNIGVYSRDRKERLFQERIDKTFFKLNRHERSGKDLMIKPLFGSPYVGYEIHESGIKYVEKE